jgi:hypothetical protein
MHSSDQEEIVQMFASYSMSAEMLFTPDEYKKGNATREPCDLVWVSRDMLLLICMQKSKDVKVEQDKHNFTQLRGWLRIWQSTSHLLTGRSALREFAYDWDDLPIVLMSVTDSPDSGASITSLSEFPKNAAEERVIITCSIPAASLVLLAQLGGSAADLARLVKRLSTEKDGVPEDVFNSWMHARREVALQRLFRVRAVDYVDYEAFLSTYAHQSLLQLRQANHEQKQVSLPGDADPKTTSTIFNDVEWFHLFDTAWLIEYTTRLVAEVPVGALGPANVAVQKKFGMYTIFISAFEGAASELQEKTLRAYGAIEVKEGFPAVGFFTFLFNRSREDEIRFMMTLGPAPTGPTDTRKLYESVRDSLSGERDPSTART